MTDHRAPSTTAPITGAVVAGVVALVGIVAGALVALYALAPVAERPDLTPIFTALSAAIPATVGALYAVASSRRLKHAAGKLDTIERQTNGELTERINAAVHDAMPGAVAQLAASPTTGLALFVPAQQAPPSSAEASAELEGGHHS